MQSTIERAFEIARSGDCKTVDDVKRCLRKERFEQISEHLNGSVMRRQLAKAIKSAEHR